MGIGQERVVQGGWVSDRNVGTGTGWYRVGEDRNGVVQGGWEDWNGVVQGGWRAGTGW